MKKFKASSMDLQQMSDVRGGGMDITIKDVKIHMTKKENKLVAVAQDQSIEISGTVTYES